MSGPAAQLLNLPLDVPEGEWEGMTPLCGFAVIKMLTAEGEACYQVAATASLTSVECLGMAHYAVLRLEHGLTAEEEEEQ